MIKKDERWVVRIGLFEVRRWKLRWGWSEIYCAKHIKNPPVFEGVIGTLFHNAVFF
jgi:hypothetical protein